MLVSGGVLSLMGRGMVSSNSSLMILGVIAMTSSVSSFCFRLDRNKFPNTGILEKNGKPELVSESEELNNPPINTV